MTTCRCTAIKHATTELRSLGTSEQEEIGLGNAPDLGAFNLYIDGFRTLFYLRKGLPVSGLHEQRDLHGRYLSESVSYEAFLTLSTAEAALLIFRARRGPAPPVRDDHRSGDRGLTILSPHTLR